MAFALAAAAPAVVAPAVAARPSALKAAPAAAPAPAARVAVAPRAMQVWQPVNNKFFETFSYLPPLTDDQIAKQIDYIVANGWTPCLEFADAEHAYVNSESTIRFGAVSSGYADNRYWTMYKLPMFGCTDASQVLKEIGNATKSFPDAYIRVAAFDAARQVQVVSFLVHRPPSAKDFQPVDRRSL